MNNSLLLFLASCFLLACNTEKKNPDDNSMEPTNPLLMEWETPFGLPPFDQIKK